MPTNQTMQQQIYNKTIPISFEILHNSLTDIIYVMQ